MAMERGRTRWRRFVLALLVGLACVALLLVGLVQGALAATFTVAGLPFDGTVNRLQSQSAVLFGTADQSRDAAFPVLDIGFGDARINDLCLSFVATGLPVVGEANFAITSGEVNAQTLLIAVENANGQSLTLTDAEIGRDAGTLDRLPGLAGPAGAFGIQSGTIALEQVRLTGRSITAGTLQLGQFAINTEVGREGCA